MATKSTKKVETEKKNPKGVFAPPKLAPSFIQTNKKPYFQGPPTKGKNATPNVRGPSIFNPFNKGPGGTPPK